MSLGLGGHPRQFAGVAPRAIRAHGSSLSLVLIGTSAHVRGPVPGLSIRALGRQATLAPVRTTSARPRRSASAVKSRPWQLASLVLINRLAHVRGPVPGLSIRAHGSSLSLVLIKRLAHVRGGGFAEAFPVLRNARSRLGQSGHGPAGAPQRSLVPPVAQAPHGDDVPGVGGLLLHLHAQAADVHVHDFLLAGVPGAPDVL